MERFSSLVTKSRPWPVIGRTIFFTSDKNRPTRDEIYFIDFWRENLSMYRINAFIHFCLLAFCLTAPGKWKNFIGSPFGFIFHNSGYRESFLQAHEHIF